MKNWVKVSLAVFAVPVISLAGLAGWVSVSVNQRLSKTYDIQPVSFKADIKGNPKLGEHIVTIRNGCIDCHGKGLGGATVMDNGAMGKVYAPNLTPAALKDWTDGEIARAIRHGVGRKGQPLVIMPAEEYIHFSQTDLAHVIAYLRSLPEVSKPNEPTKLGPVASVLLATDRAPLLIAEKLNHSQPFSAEQKPEASAAYGEYIAKTACMGCHQSSLKGGPIAVGPPDWPPASDLTQTGLGTWKEADFVQAMRSGVRPDGSKIKPPMPIKLTAQYSDLEIKALWLYLQTLKS